MTDDSELVRPRHSADDRYGETLLYDFAKFLTTLALIALGGVLTLTQTVDRSDIKLFNIILVIVSLALAGVLAMTTANSLAYARAAGQEPHPKLPSVIKASMALLGIGTGAFIGIW